MRTIDKGKTYLDKFALVISDVLDTDVIITDTHMNVIGKKLVNFSIYTKISYGSLISTVLSENKPIYIDDKSKVKDCRECKAFKNCKIDGFVGVPIHYRDKTIGVLSLILDRSKGSKFFDKIDSTIIFMKNMAVLIAKRIHEHNLKKNLKAKVSRIETILNFMEEAVVYVDGFGNVIYKNKTFRDMFEIKEIIKNISSIYPDALTYIRKGKKTENVKISIERNEGYFYGTFTCEPIISETNSSRDFLCCFIPYSKIQSNSAPFESGTLVTFSWLAKYIRKETIEKAKKLVEECVLIEGEDNAINELIAKAMINHSTRRFQEMKVIYMQNVYRELMDSFLFDERGLLWRMNKGTIVIVQPERMLIYAQDKLAEYIKNEKYLIEHNLKMELSVRLIFCTAVNLAKLVRKGIFSEKLYKEISAHTITEPETVYNNKALFKKFFESGIIYYSKIYGKKQELSPIDEFFETLWNERKMYELGDLETFLEAFVRDGEIKINREDDGDQSIRKMEIEKIKELVNKGISKREICKILGYSRSTLYRKMKKANI